MIDVILSKRFERNFKSAIQRQPELEFAFEKKLALFVENPRNAALGTHKLQGKLRHKLAFWVTPKLRVVFSNIDAQTVLFERFGTHDQVYE